MSRYLSLIGRHLTTASASITNPRAFATMTTDTILLYTAKVCPYAARAELALEEAGLKYNIYEIDLANKPSWYAEKINKASKVPCLVLNPDSEQEYKLPESQVIVEYIADTTGKIFTSSDPKDKAWSRYLVERYSQLVSTHYMTLVFKQDPAAVPLLIEGLIQFSELLDKQGPFAQGAKFGYADIHIAPFLGRTLAASQAGLMPVDPNNPTVPVHEAVNNDPKLERVKTWWNAIESTQAWKKVWDAEKFLNPFSKRVEQLKQQKQ